MWWHYITEIISNYIISIFDHLRNGSVFSIFFDSKIVHDVALI